MDAAERAAWQRADELLAQLLELPPDARAGAIAGLAPPPEVRRRLDALLAAASDDGAGLLDLPASWPVSAQAPERAPTLCGRRLGPYVLDEEIGRGGMAVVYRAHRVDGVFQQEVAVKVLGIGLVALAGGDRFRREQQVLARLRHPHIATMLDGGVAADGTPWLAMELLHGQSITAWCAERRAAPRERVALMLQACEAVAFAHRNLVVHRDLKPGNILVDTAGRLKLLDFGIAKLLGPEPEAQLTLAQERFLTPGYAAPEQVTGEAVTTATDVYALGRVLERLLAVDPPVADSDLHNIASRAVRAEPEQRYADAAALAADLESWRAGRPVSATGNRLAYRLRKLARRHRAAVTAGALVLTVAASGLAATLWQAARARSEERAAATVNAFLVDLFKASDPERARGEDPPASELLHRGAERARARLGSEPLLEAQLLHVIGSIQSQIGKFEAAEESLVRALALRSRHLSAGDRELAETRVQLGQTRYELGRVDEAVELLREALAELDDDLDPRAEPRLEAEVRLADMLVVQGRYSEARQRMELVLERIGPDPGELIELALDAEYTLGVALGELQEVDEAKRRLEHVVEIERRRSGGFSRDLALYLNEYGVLHQNMANHAAAEAPYREALAIKRRLYGEDHPQVSAQLSNLGMVLDTQGRSAEALTALESALAIARRVHGGNPNPQVAAAIEALASALRKSDRRQEAIPLYAEAVSVWRALPDTAVDQSSYANCLRNYGSLLLELGDPNRAEPLLREAVAGYDQIGVADPIRPALSRALLGEALVALGRAAEGVELLSPALAILEPTPYGWQRTFFVRLQLALTRGELVQQDFEPARQRLAAIRSHLDSSVGDEWEPLQSAAAELARHPAFESGSAGAWSTQPEHPHPH